MKPQGMAHKQHSIPWAARAPSIGRMPFSPTPSSEQGIGLACSAIHGRDGRSGLSVLSRYTLVRRWAHQSRGILHRNRSCRALQSACERRGLEPQVSAIDVFIEDHTSGLLRELSRMDKTEESTPAHGFIII